ncbi:MAG: hypothetical protein NVS2B3_07680 [Vulcanimicrobiaceae bacterium]
MPLGLDTFAIAIVLGFRGFSPWRPALVFALFESVMPIVGIVAGRLLGARFATVAEVLGGLVLLGVAIHAAREAFDEDETSGLGFGSFRTALAAGFGISIDELVVGFPIGAVALPIAPLLLTIGAQTLVVTVGGIALGRRLGAASGTRTARTAGIAAALAFGALGISLLVEALHR